MSDSIVYGSLAFSAESATPRVHTVHTDGRLSLALTSELDSTSIYVRGNYHELVQLANDILHALEEYQENTALGAGANEPREGDDTEPPEDHDYPHIPERNDLEGMFATPGFTLYLHKFGYNPQTMTPGAIRQRYLAYVTIPKEARV